MDAASLDALDKILRCPIHFGLIEKPRILPCGHALCKNCLDAILARNMALCPICKCDIGTGRAPPHCFALSQVAELLSSQNSHKTSRANSHRDAYVDPAQQRVPRQLTAEKESEKSVVIMRWNMAHMASYRTYHEIPWSSGKSQIEVQPMGICCVSEDLQNSDLFLLNDGDSSIVRCSEAGTKSTPFALQLHPDETFSPQFLSCANGKIYVTGVLQSGHKDPAGVLLLVGQDGAVLKRSSEFPLRSDRNGHPPVSGFHVDPKSGEVAVVCPSSHTVHLLAGDLEELDCFVIDDPPLAPYFVARSSDDLWVTCPQDGRILLINTPTGHLEYLFAEEIFDCVPSHIARTTDDRIVVLDSQEPRVFWLQRTDQNMIVQKLDLGKELKNKEISSIGAVSEDRISLVTQDGIFFLRPKRFPLHRKHHSMCVLL